MTSEPTASCPSNFTLDRYFVGELLVQESRALEAHLAHCAACQARWAALSQFNSSFAEPWPPLSVNTNRSAMRAPLQLSSPPWKKLAVSGAFISAVSALAAVFMLSLQPSQNAEEVRTKGSVRLSYHISRDGTVWLAGPNEKLRENDKIQFVFRAAEPGFLAVFSVDGRGEVSSYYPAEGEVAGAYSPERPRLSTSTLLDDALGDEVFVAVFCKHSFSKAEAAQKLEEAKAIPDQFRFETCSVETLRATKVGL
jgi:hypothetical protein